MIRAVTSYHLLRLTQDSLLRRACCGYLLVFMAFSLWGFGERLASEGMLSVALIQILGQRVWAGLILPLTFLTPWLVMRHMPTPHHDDGVRLIAQAGLTPWQAVLGHLIALHLYLMQLMFLSLPVMIFMYQFGAINMRELGTSYAVLLMWLLLVQLIACSWRLCVANGLSAIVMTFMTILVLGVSFGQFLHTLGAIVALRLMILVDAGLALVVLRLCNAKLSNLRV